MEKQSRRLFVRSLQATSCTGLAAAALSTAALAAPGKRAPNEPASAGLGIFNVREFGAKGDSVTLDTAAVQAAIDACTRSGGGVVVFPNGAYLSGTIELKDYVTLHLAPQATLLGSPTIRDYPEKATGVQDIDQKPRPTSIWALVYARGAKGIALEGAGVIDGQSKAFQDQWGPRPRLLYFHECSDVSLRDLTLKDAGKWTAHFALCDHLRLQGVKLRSFGAVNNDGLDIDSCREVLISDCDIACGDDAICLKSTFPQPCKNVVVTNCTLRTDCNGLKLGTHSVGGFENVTVSNCAIYDANLGGVKIETVDGGSLRDVIFSNIAMDNVGVPIFVRLNNRGLDFGQTGIEKPRPVATLKNVLLSNIRARVTKTRGRPFHPIKNPTPHPDIFGCSISGIPGHPVENIALENISITFAPGGTLEQALRMDVPEKEDAYPESHMFGVLPAYGFYVRHAKGVSMSNVRLEIDGTDMRPAIICDDIEDLELFCLQAAAPAGTQPLIRLRDARNVFIHGCRPLGNVETFVLVEGARSSAIALSGNDLRRVKKSVDAGAGLPPGTVQESANVTAV